MEIPEAEQGIKFDQKKLIQAAKALKKLYKPLVDIENLRNAEYIIAGQVDRKKLAQFQARAKQAYEDFTRCHSSLLCSIAPCDSINEWRNSVERALKEYEPILLDDDCHNAPSRYDSAKNIVNAFTHVDLWHDKFSKSVSDKKIFIVHGHDEAAKSIVARFVNKLKLVEIILEEQSNKGRTIIKKFEAVASKVGFAIVLLTPDDIAASKRKPNKTRLRARQNVIYELGYFCGVLGRDNVCVLQKKGVEIPTDIKGMVYIELDDSDGWHLKLAKEIKSAGINVDLGNII